MWLPLELALHREKKDKEGEEREVAIRTVVADLVRDGGIQTTANKNCGLLL